MIQRKAVLLGLSREPLMSHAKPTAGNSPDCQLIAWAQVALTCVARSTKVSQLFGEQVALLVH